MLGPACIVGGVSHLTCHQMAGETRPWLGWGDGIDALCRSEQERYDEGRRNAEQEQEVDK